MPQEAFCQATGTSGSMKYEADGGPGLVDPARVLAMAVRGTKKHCRIVEIGRRHFDATARSCGLRDDMDAIVDEVVERTAGVIDEVGARLPEGFPARVYETIVKGLRDAARHLQATRAR